MVFSARESGGSYLEFNKLLSYLSANGRSQCAHVAPPAN